MQNPGSAKESERSAEHFFIYNQKRAEKLWKVVESGRKCWKVLEVKEDLGTFLFTTKK